MKTHASKPVNQNATIVALAFPSPADLIKLTSEQVEKLWEEEIRNGRRALNYIVESERQRGK
jgi:hypothetical protein